MHVEKLLSDSDRLDLHPHGHFCVVNNSENEMSTARGCRAERVCSSLYILKLLQREPCPRHMFRKLMSFPQLSVEFALSKPYMCFDFCQEVSHIFPSFADKFVDKPDLSKHVAIVNVIP